MKSATGRSAIRFLLWFLGIYLIGNLIYGLYIQGLSPLPDAFTKSVSAQTSSLLNMLGQPTHIVVNSTQPTVLLQENGATILRIYEGCNGINVLIVFAAFVVAFGGRPLHQVAFVGVGSIALHVANLARIGLLYWVGKNHERYFYYVHKYVFTIVLYLVVLVLWAIWVYREVKTRPSTNDAVQ